MFGVLVYPLWNGLQTSTKFYRYGRAVSDIGLDNYRRLWSDPEFLDSLWVTLRFVTIAVTIETVLGFALALFCAREFAGIRLLRTVLIVPMVITPVVVAIVFRLIYANDAGMLTALSLSMGGGRSRSSATPSKLSSALSLSMSGSGRRSFSSFFWRGCNPCRRSRSKPPRLTERALGGLLST